MVLVAQNGCKWLRGAVGDQVEGVRSKQQRASQVATMGFLWTDERWNFSTAARNMPPDSDSKCSTER